MRAGIYARIYIYICMYSATIVEKKTRAMFLHRGKAAGNVRLNKHHG